ncbi:MAG TPA: hypothetical protein VMS22_11225 [Candidatus Eisenbacteria bacterium]|nr:hypothetical protein [Candidatus Eisenbacteria bacterium]
MDPGYFSALAALAGSTIGGMTSLVTAWQTQHAQFRAQRRQHDIERREELYKNFIEESSRLYADAYEHDKADVSNLVKLYALVSRMRVLSTGRVVEEADQVVRLIIETYLAPNKTLRDLEQDFVAREAAMDPLRDFSNACRAELPGRTF